MTAATTYVALLRGINVGGNARVDMSRLRRSFEKLGLRNVTSYINSGNVIFKTDQNPEKLVPLIEKEIASEFGLEVPVVIRSYAQMQAINKALPPTWLNNSAVKTDVMFLWEDVASPKILDELKTRPDIDKVKYIDGTIIWHVSRENQTKSGLLKIIGTPLYKRMSIRNANTLRKLCALMEVTNGD